MTEKKSLFEADDEPIPTRAIVAFLGLLAFGVCLFFVGRELEDYAAKQILQTRQGIALKIKMDMMHP